MDKRIFFKLLSSTLAITTKYVIFVEPLYSVEGGVKITDINKCDEVAIGLQEDSIELSEARLVIGDIPCYEIAKIVIDYCYNQTFRYLNRQDCINFDSDKKIDLNTDLSCVIEILSVLISFLWEDFDFIDFNKESEVVFIWWDDSSVTHLDVKGMSSLDILYKVFAFCYNEQTMDKYLK